MDLFKKTGIMKKSQATTEYLLLLGIIILIVVLLSYYVFKPKEDITLAKSSETLDLIVDYSNKVAELGPGNKLSVKVEVPKAIESVEMRSGEINMQVFEGEKATEFHRQLKTSITGCPLSDKDGNPVAGVYNVIFESIGNTVCMYTEGRRQECCHCFSDDITPNQPKFVDIIPNVQIMCSYGGSQPQRCDNINLSVGGYFYNITGLYSKCVNAYDENIKGHVTYTIYNRKNEVIMEESVYSSDKSGFFNLTNIKFMIENSGDVNITATCYEECYDFRDEKDLLSNMTFQPIFIQYGVVCPFLIDKNGYKVFFTRGWGDPCFQLVNPPNYETSIVREFPLINPTTGSVKDYYNLGQTKKGDQVIVRTGFECIWGECVDVNASFYHESYIGS
jgi:hypothetical protein